MSGLYPIKFEYQLKEKIWGGEKLSTMFGKNSPSHSVGESWEVSGVPGSESVVLNGHLKGKTLTELLKTYKAELVGDKVFDAFQYDFPLLVKFIDAKADLSIQVHPNDELAQKRGHVRGKSEMWYICEADEGSSLITGFNRELNKEEYLTLVEKGEIESVLNRELAEKGDAFYVPAGRIHTIGKGLLLAEIQQSSDVTYRVSDFGRKDADGNLRELHTELSVDALDFRTEKDFRISYQEAIGHVTNLVSNPYFVVNKVNLENKITKDYILKSKNPVLFGSCFYSARKNDKPHNWEMISFKDNCLEEKFGSRN